MDATFGRYRQYQERIHRLAKICKWLIDHIILLSVIAASLAAVLVGIGTLPGIITEPLAASDITYGDALDYSASALLSSVEYEFSADGAEGTWTDRAPDRVGDYMVRAVTKNGYGKKRYSDPVAFSVLPRLLSLDVKDLDREYGSEEPYKKELVEVSGLLPTDRLDTVRFAAKSNGSSEHVLTVEDFVVRNADGDNVSGCYQTKLSDGVLTYVKRKLSVSSSDASKYYDGKPLDIINGKITSGSLARGDTVKYIGDAAATVTEPNRNTGAVFTVEITNESGENVTSYYEIEYSYGTLKVELCPITVSLKDVTKVYDGTPLVRGEAYISSGSLPEGFTLVTSYNPADSLTEPGSLTVDFQCSVLDAAGNDVSDFFEIKHIFGKLTVTPRSLKLYSEDQSKMYDGTPLRAEKFSITSGSLAAGHKITYIFDESSTLVKVGTGKALFTAEIRNESGQRVDQFYAVTYRYGDLTVTPRPLKIETLSAQKQYDATPLNNKGYTILEGSLVSGHVLNVVYIEAPIDAGEYTNHVGVRILSGLDGDVASNYEITVNAGKLVITPIKLVIMTGSERKTYDGRPLRNEFCQVVSGSVLPIHSLRAAAVGEQTEVGKSDNILSVAILDKNGIDQSTRGYEITEQLGVLEVLPRQTDPDSGETDEGGGEGGEEEGGGGGELSGSLSENTNLSIPGNENDKIVMFTINATRGGSIYFRTGSYGDYTGKGFGKAPEYGQDGAVIMSYPAKSAVRSGRSANAQNVRIILKKELQADLIPYYSYDISGWWTGDNIADKLGTSYVVSAYTGLLHTDLTRTAYSAETADEIKYREFVYENYLTIPNDTKAALLEYAAKKGIDANDPNLVSAIQYCISTAAKYDDQTPQYPANVDHVLYFLNTVKSGVCQQFAAAGTMMFRAFGIPARYTVGYSASNVPAGVDYDVLGASAHAWVEVYLDGIGWVMVEVTGGDFSSDHVGGDDGSGNGSGSGPLKIEKPKVGESNEKLAEVIGNSDKTVYLRAMSYGDFLGNAWGESKVYPTMNRPALTFAARVAQQNGHARESIKYRLFPAAPDMVPYYYTGYVVGSNDVFYLLNRDDPNGSYGYTRNLFLDLEYDDFKQLDGSYSDEREYRAYAKKTYLSVPETTRIAMKYIASQNGIVAGSADIIGDIQKLVSRYVTYDRNAPTYPDGTDAGVYFFSDAKKANSVQFATAAALMYRTMGIPARVTVGCRVEARAGETVEVYSGTHSHAWVEVYVDGIGWIMVEVTPLAKGTPTNIGGETVMVRPDGKYYIEMGAGGVIKTYDGRPIGEFIQNAVFLSALTDGALYPGHTLSVVDEAVFNTSEVGTYIIPIASICIKDSYGRDVTDSYVINSEEIEINIKPRKLTIHTISAEKKYDGTPLAAPKWWISSGSLAPDDRLICDMPTTHTDVGNVLNKISINILDKNGNSVISQYSVTIREGHLTVTN